MVCLSITSRGKFDEQLKWAFSFYDRDKDNFITYDEMFLVVDAIYKMVGNMVALPPDEDTAKKRVDKMFRLLDTVRKYQFLFVLLIGFRLGW